MNPEQILAPDYVPLLAGQRAVLSGLAASPTAYLIQRGFRSPQRLEEERLRGAAWALLRSCPALRVRLSSGDDGLQQTFDGAFAGMTIASCTREEAEARIRQVELDPLDGTVWNVMLLRLPHVDWLVMTFHHFAVDGVSVEVLAKRFWWAYENLGIESSTMDVGPYVDAVRQIVARRAFSDWDGLRPAPCLLRAKADIERLSIEGNAAARYGPNEFSNDEIASLQALAQSAGVTLSTALMVAYAVLLAKLSATLQITIGMPVSLRDGAASELVGPFFNTVPVTLELDADATVLHSIETAAESLWCSLSLRDVPIDELATAGGRPQPIFDCMYVFDYEDDCADERQVVLPEGIEIEPGRSDFLLTLLARRSKEGLSLRWELSSDLGPDRTSIPHAYRRILAAILADPGCSIGSLTARAPRTEGGASGDSGQPDTILDKLCRQFERHPDRVAVIGDGRSMSYGELQRWVQSVAVVLRQHGATPGTRVVIQAPRDERLPALLLAVLWTGAAYVAIDDSWPAERIGALISETAPALVIGEMPHADIPSLRADDLYAEAERIGVSPGIHGATAGATAYVMYTSGSLGHPKGVVVSHQSVAHLAWATRERLRAFGILNEASVIGWTASISFDASVEGLAQLCCGTALCVIQRECLFDTDRLRGVLDRANVDVLDCTPAIVRVLLADPFFLAGRPISMLIGGESIDAHLWQQIQAYCRQHKVRACNMYGPTEACVTCAIESVEECDSPSIGRPTGKTRFELADEDGRFLDGNDACGELWIRGPALALGYLGRPEETSLSFHERGGQRYYRTGDRARRCADGRYAFLGRRDEQVKLNGFRIELEEVRNALGACAGVHSCGVAVQTAPGGLSRLVAAVVAHQPKPDPEWGGETLKSLLASRLPLYMVPDEIRIVERLRLTSNDKISSQSVLSVFGSEAMAPPDAGGTEVEARLRRVWERVLGRADFGMEAQFSEVGGHSLQWTHLRALIHQEFSVRLTHDMLSRNSTFQDQLKLLRHPASLSDSAVWPFRALGSTGSSLGESMEDRLARLMTEHDVLNAQVSHLAPGRAVHWALGGAEGAADSGSRFRLTCIRKLLHTAVVLHRHQCGRIDLHQDLRGEVRELSKMPYPVRLHDLLRFVGGLDNTVIPAAHARGECLDQSMLLRLVAAAQCVPPGGVPRYGDEGTLVADVVFSRRGLETCEEELSRLFEQLRIDQAASLAPPDLPESVRKEPQEHHALALSGNSLSNLLWHMFLSGEYLNEETVGALLTHATPIPASTVYHRMTYGGFITDDFIAFASDGIVHANFIAIRPSTREVLCVHAGKAGAGRFLDAVARCFGMRYMNDTHMPMPDVQSGVYGAAIGTLRIDVGKHHVTYSLKYRDPCPRLVDSEGSLVWDGSGTFVPEDPVAARSTGGLAFFVENSVRYVRIRHWLFWKYH